MPALDEPDFGRREADDHGWIDSGGAKVAHTGVAARLTQLLTIGLHDQGMVKKLWQFGATEHSRQLDLSARRRQEIQTTDDQIHAIVHVVHRHGKLIRPVAVPVLEQRVAALICRRLDDLANGSVGKALRPFVELDTNAQAGGTASPGCKRR